MRLTESIKKIWEILRSWFKLPRTLRVTGAGWKFLALTVVVGFAAVNTGNNLLYLILGLMLSFITVSGILSELMLRQLKVERTFPKHIFAGQAVPVSLSVKNGKRSMSSLSLLIEDLSQKRSAEQSRYILKISPQKSEQVVYPVTFTTRGRHRPGNIRISTCYPFGFFKKSASFAEQDDEILVYPALETLAQREISGLIAQLGDVVVSGHKGNGQDMYNIREYAQGDNHARIHWKSTAKLATLMVKEFEHEHKKKISLFLDITFPPEAPRTGEIFQNVESAVSMAASYAVHFTRNNFQVRLITPSQTSPFDSGQRHLFSLLRVLALTQAVDGDSRRDFLGAVQQGGRAGALKLLVSANMSVQYPSGMFTKIVRTGERGRAENAVRQA